MRLSELSRWQWDGYPRYHGSRTNLVIHLLFVPLFWLGGVGIVAGTVRMSIALVLASVVALVVSLAAQGVGHGREAVPPEPFTSRWNAFARIFIEQFFTFPRFVLTGRWLRTYRGVVTSESAESA